MFEDHLRANVKYYTQFKSEKVIIINFEKEAKLQQGKRNTAQCFLLFIL